jgi:hypothetical protein
LTCSVLGAELFPNKPFNLLLRYNFRRAEELRLEDQRNFSGISGRFWFKMNKLKFNYSVFGYFGRKHACLINHNFRIETTNQIPLN